MEEKKTPEETGKVKKQKKSKDITIKPNKKGRHIMGFMNFLRILVLPVYWLCKPYRLYGHKKVADGACIYVSNHYTLLDPAFSASTTWEGIHYLGKSEIFETPVLGAVARKAKAICVNRDGNDVRTMLDCFKCLKNGDKIAIFPEGTRNKGQEIMLPFHHGAAMMAIKTKTPIIPIVIYKKPRFFHMTHVIVGEPVELTEYYGKKLSAEEIAEADDKIRDLMLKLREEHTQYLLSKKKKKA